MILKIGYLWWKSIVVELERLVFFLKRIFESFFIYFSFIYWTFHMTFKRLIFNLFFKFFKKLHIVVWRH
jgi:hypothetical protein